jgi:hypothetical protein
MRWFPVLALAVVAPLAAAPASARTWSQDWTVGAHPTLVVTTNDAKVRLHRGTPGRVSATVEYTLEVWGLHSRIQPPIIEFSRAGDVITVNARTHGNNVFFGGMTERFHVDVTLPPACDVKVRTGDGAIESEPLTGTFDLQTGDGHVRVHGLFGRCTIATGDGGVDADSLDGSLTARTSDGHLKVQGRFDGLTLHTGDGRIVANIARGSQPTEPWLLETGDGGLTANIPRNLQGVVDASTAEGHLRVNLPISVDDHGSRRALRGQLNGGQVPIRIRTGDGTLVLGLSE